MRVIGIDPGLGGYVSCVELDRIVWSEPIPTLRIGKGKSNKRSYDSREMARMLSGGDIWSGDCRFDLVVIEKQRPMKGQGLSSTFNIGVGFALWVGICAGMGVRYTEVNPQIWQKVMFRDITGDNPKAKSIIACQRLFPNVDLRKNDRCRAKNDNKSDSILIGYYGLNNMEQF